MRVSSRLPQHFQPNALTAELEGLREAGVSWIDLTVSNPTRCGFTYPVVEIRQALGARPSISRGRAGAPAERGKEGDEGPLGIGFADTRDKTISGGSKDEEPDAASRWLPPQPEGLSAKGSLAVSARSDDEPASPLTRLRAIEPSALNAAPGEYLDGLLGVSGILNYAPDPQGSLAVREAVAAWHGHGVEASDLVLTASTSEAYSWLFKLLGDPGDEVLVPSPSYPLFEWLARLEGLTAQQIPAYHADRWHLDLDALEAACGPHTRAIVVVNPNNPTGHFLSRGEWVELTQLCARRNLALIVDEVFADYPLEPAPDHLPTALEAFDPACPVFVLSGLSKVAALPQIKLGWIIARGPAAKALIEPLTFIADQFLSVSALPQAVAPEILRLAPRIQDQIRTRLKSNLRALDQALGGFPALSRLPVEGGWSVILRRPALDSDEACALRILRESRVLVQPGHYFDLPSEGCLVLSLLPEESLFQRAITRLLPET
jgi:hypothetical protein